MFKNCSCKCKCIAKDIKLFRKYYIKEKNKHILEKQGGCPCCRGTVDYEESHFVNSKLVMRVNKFKFRDITHFKYHHQLLEYIVKMELECKDLSIRNETIFDDWEETEDKNKEFNKLIAAIKEKNNTIKKQCRTIITKNIKLTTENKEHIRDKKILRRKKKLLEKEMSTMVYLKSIKTEEKPLLGKPIEDKDSSEESEDDTELITDDLTKTSEYYLNILYKYQKLKNFLVDKQFSIRDISEMTKTSVHKLRSKFFMLKYERLKIAHPDTDNLNTADEFVSLLMT